MFLFSLFHVPHPHWFSEMNIFDLIIEVATESCA